MAGKEKPQILDLRRAKVLSAMGVQVWHLRPAAGETVPVVAKSPPTAQAKAPQPVLTPEREVARVTVPEVAQPEPVSAQLAPPVPLEFLWAKGSACMLLFSPNASSASMTQAKDMLRYADWRAQHSASGPTKSGEFKWPQLLDTTTGTPVRALGVFIEKHFPETTPWFLVADDLAEDLVPWLTECLQDKAHEKILILQNFNESVTDAAQKKQIWQKLQQIR